MEQTHAQKSIQKYYYNTGWYDTYRNIYMSNNTPDWASAEYISLGMISHIEWIYHYLTQVHF